MSNLKTLQAKIFHSLADLEPNLAGWRKNKEKIAFTNGCFDIVHLGHIDYLARAADLGTKLIVGLNSDASTRKLKGPTRPINDEKGRASILAALAFVDAVILFDEDTPLSLIKGIKPDVLIKGADYTIDKIVGAKEVLANQGTVETITFVPGYSTSAIEKRIRASNQ